MAAQGEGPEQHFLFRIQDEALADRVRGILREDGTTGDMQLLFEGDLLQDRMHLDPFHTSHAGCMAVDLVLYML